MMSDKFDFFFFFIQHGTCLEKQIAQNLRDYMLKSFIISFGFEATGISPINVNKPLQSQYAINNVPHDTDNLCQNYWMNSEENLSNLFYKEYGREITEADFNIKDILAYFILII